MDKKEHEKIYIQSNVKTAWQIIGELAVVLGSFTTFFLLLHGEIKSLDNKIETLTLQQSVRTDKLYEMFYDLIKETRGK